MNFKIYQINLNIGTLLFSAYVCYVEHIHRYGNSFAYKNTIAQERVIKVSKSFMKIHNNNVNNWLFCNKLELYRHRSKLFKILKMKKDIDRISIWDEKILGLVVNELETMSDVDWEIWQTIKESNWEKRIPKKINKMMRNATKKI